MQPQFYGAAADYNKPKGHSFFTPKMLLIIGGVLVGLLIAFVVVAILSSLSSGPRNDVARLIAREQQLQDIITKNAASIGNGDLKKISGEASLYLATDIFALTDAFASEIPDSIIASETDDTIAGQLKEALQAGKFDQTYLSILSVQVNTSLGLAQKIKAQTSGEQTRTAAAQAEVNLTTIANQLQKITL